MPGLERNVTVSGISYCPGAGVSAGAVALKRSNSDRNMDECFGECPDLGGLSSSYDPGPGRSADRRVSCAESLPWPVARNGAVPASDDDGRRACMSKLGSNGWYWPGDGRARRS